MKSAVIVDAVRTPVGRAHKEKGWFRDVRSDDLAVDVVKALVDRTGIDTNEIEDVVLGNTQQQLEQGFNVGRSVALMAGLPAATGGATINRLCGSSLQALNQAAHSVMAGFEDVQIVGGLEHMHHIADGRRIRSEPQTFSGDVEGRTDDGYHSGVSGTDTGHFARGTRCICAPFASEGNQARRKPVSFAER